MSAGEIVLVVVLCVLWGPPLVDLVLSIAFSLRLGRDPGGDPAPGLVIFVEPVRAFGVRWGQRSLCAGLRRAGFAGEIQYWQWQQAWRAWLILPVIMGRRILQREAERLAECVARRRREGPDRRIYLIGYSAGGFVVARALEMLPEGVKVDAAALLAPAVDPRRDLEAPAGHVRGKLLVVSSLLDWVIVGLGTLLLGTCDRRHTPSMGMVGPRGPAAENVAEIRWRPRLLRLGHFGGHFSTTACGFVAGRLAPAMGIA